MNCLIPSARSIKSSFIAAKPSGRLPGLYTIYRASLILYVVCIDLTCKNLMNVNVKWSIAIVSVPIFDNILNPQYIVQNSFVSQHCSL